MCVSQFADIWDILWGVLNVRVDVVEMLKALAVCQMKRFYKPWLEEAPSSVSLPAVRLIPASGSQSAIVNKPISATLFWGGTITTL